MKAPPLLLCLFLLACSKQTEGPESTQECLDFEEKYYSDGALKYTERVFFDVNQNVIRRITQSSDPKWIKSDTLTNENRYDNAGNLVESTTRNARQVLVERKIQEFDAARRITRRITYSDPQPTGLILTQQYTYDAAGRLIQVETLTSAGAPTTITYEFNDQGKTSVIKSYTNSTLKYLTENTFDAKGRKTESKMTEYGRSGPTVTRRTYEYDEAGNWEKSFLNGQLQYFSEYQSGKPVRRTLYDPKTGQIKAISEYDTGGFFQLERSFSNGQEDSRAEYRRFC